MAARLAAEDDQRGSRLRADKDLDFTVTECSVEQLYEVGWKVLNRGDEAEHRNEIRGQIIQSNRPNASTSGPSSEATMSSSATS